MKRTRFLTAVALLFILTASLVSACGDEETAGPPIVLQEQDRSQITQMVTDYVTALRDRDVTKAQAQLPAGVPSATVTKSMNTVRDEGFQLVAVSGITSDSEGATATLQLTDKSGKAVTRVLEFRIDKGEWRIWSPQLKLPA